MDRHQWREHTAEGLRFFRADHHGGRWTIASQLRGEDDWTPYDPIPADLWQTLRDVLWRKYQRRRCPWKLIEEIDRRLENPAAE